MKKVKCEKIEKKVYEVDVGRNSQIFANCFYNEEKRFYDSNSTIRLLKHLDDCNVKSVRVSTYSIRLIYDDKVVVFRNFKRLYYKYITKYMPKANRKIKWAIIKYQKRLDKLEREKLKREKNPKSKKISMIKYVAAGLVMACLGKGAFDIALNNIDNKAIDESILDEASNLDEEIQELAQLALDNTNKIEESKAIETRTQFSSDKVEDEVDEETNDLDENLEEEKNETNNTLKENEELEIIDLDEEEFDDDYPIENKIASSNTYTVDNVTYGSFSLNYKDRCYTQKANNARDKWYDLVESISPQWGFSPNIIMAMLTQESGGEIENDLMQIIFSEWDNKIFSMYNFDENRYYNFILTDRPENYEGQDIICITREKLKEPENNITVACICLSESIKSMNGHIAAGIQTYNLGTGNMDIVFRATNNNTGNSKNKILADQSNISFMNYTKEPHRGDPNYLYNVMSFLENPDEGISYKYIDSNGQICETVITINKENGKKLELKNHL